MWSLADTEGDKLPVAMTVVEAGRALGLSRSAAYRAAQKDELPVIRLAGRMFVPTAELLRMLHLGRPDTTDSDEVVAEPSMSGWLT